ncbi:transglycosylase SLT domain-containing protein [Streptomyces sp. NPDC057654]|uniref:aggregation-promoting factor C-terminal-like domain-containing protein n=1 Tax=Streptomyces sp. NPDC057654 TaxID=3346196 RepID=UPI0036B3BB3A
MLEGNRVSRISVRGFAVASATAVTTVGAVVGVASGSEQGTAGTVEATAADSTILADIPTGQSVQAQTASLTQQADTQSAAAASDAKKAVEESARKQAAKDAQAKKDAADAKAKKDAEEKAKKEHEEKEKEASRSGEHDGLADLSAKSSYSISEIKAMAQQIVPGDQFQCFSNIVNNESTWNYKATNPSSGAYGLMQALPAGKMASAGADWQTNPATQIKWGLSYMNGKFGSPCGAWSYWQAHGNY